MSSKFWLEAAPTANLRTLSVQELRRRWVANRNNLDGVLAADELMRRYDADEIAIHLKEKC